MSDIGTIQRIKTVDDGYDVQLYDGRILCLRMDTATSCCESPGYFMSHDNLVEFLHARLLSVRVVNGELRGYDLLPEYGEDYKRAKAEGNVMFVNLETSKGMLQFVAYNDHNGYYSHEAQVYWLEKNLLHTERL